MALRWLLDTNVISEIRRPVPNSSVIEFLATLATEETCLSAFTIAELRKGEARARLRNLENADELGVWIDAIQSDFELRIITLDDSIARVWGEMMAPRDRPVVDMFIAATALANGLTLVTRNVRDFEGLEIDILNPWE